MAVYDSGNHVSERNNFMYYQKLECKACGAPATTAISVDNPNRPGSGILADLCPGCHSRRDRDQVLQERIFGHEMTDEQRQEAATRASYEASRIAYYQKHPEEA